jgi:hypothetical protein
VLDLLLGWPLLEPLSLRVSWDMAVGNL